MKTKLLPLLLIVGIGFLTSCGNDYDDLPQEKSINGTWNLKNVQGGMTFRNFDYPRGDVKWTFNQTDSTLTVQKKIGNDYAFMLDNGSFDFYIEQNGETQFLYVDGYYRMEILSMDNNLIINDGFADGFTAEFKR